MGMPDLRGIEKGVQQDVTVTPAPRCLLSFTYHPSLSHNVEVDDIDDHKD